MAEFDDLKANLKKLRDELVVQIHLGSKEAQAQWAVLEQKWEQFAVDAELHESGKEIGAAARALAGELKDGFDGIRKALQRHDAS